MASAVVLLAGAGLLVRSFANVFGEPPGFATENVLAFRLAPSTSRHPERGDITRLYADLTDRIGMVPGVMSVASSSYLPIEGGVWMNGFSFDEEPEENRSAHVRSVTPDYFDALSIPTVLGRGFTPDDIEGSTEVAIVNEAFVRRYIPDGEDPIGTHLTMNRPSRVVVGVVADTRFLGLELAAEPEFYTPHAQQSQWWLRRFQWIVVRTAGEPASAFRRIREIVRQVDPTLPISKVTTMRDIIGEDVSAPRVRGVLVGVFALVALILACVGISGVMAYSVASRAREFGVRVALGARQGELMRGVLWKGLRLTAVGGVVGLVGALAMGRLLSSLLYEVSPTDPATLVGVVVVLTGAALLASYFPARRILGIDPVEALRSE
jgi:predicted permease